MIEIPDEGDDGTPLPVLPVDYPFVIELESLIDNGACCPIDSGRLPDPYLLPLRDWSDRLHRTERQDDDAARRCELDDTNECLEPSPPIHITICPAEQDMFLGERRLRYTHLLPGLIGQDRVSIHSSRQSVHWTGEEDKHHLCDEAQESAISIIGMRSARIVNLTPLERPERIDALRSKWFAACEDLMGPIPLSLPPLREINHEINLLDDSATYNYHMPRCPDVLRPKLREKINRYVLAGWWEGRDTLSRPGQHTHGRGPGPPPLKN